MGWQISWTLFAWLLLAACGGGGGGGGSGVDPRLARLDVYETQKIRVLGDIGVTGLAVTDATSMPVTGSAEFAGYATIRVAVENPLVLFGDAVVSVGFDTADASGRIDAVFGSDSSGQVIDYDGVINLAGGVCRPAICSLTMPGR